MSTKVAIYARYSSANQTEQSIEGQIRDCYSYAERNDFTVVAEYIDRAISGLTDDRPDFQRMIEDSKKREFDFILVWKLDRFSRDRYDSAIYKRELKKNGVRVLSVMENVGHGDESIILESILESMAEFYSRDLSKKVKRGLRETCLKGNFPGGFVPLGYQVADRKIVPDPEIAPLIRRAFERFAAGVPTGRIVEELNAAGVRGNQGRPLTYSTVNKILKNRKYIGEFIHGENRLVDAYEPLIDPETFERVQARISGNKRAPAAGKADEPYRLRGKIFCGYCGSALVGESGRGKLGAVYHYYACAQKKKHRACRKKNERKGFLEWYVAEQTTEYVLNPERLDYIARGVIRSLRNDDKTKDIFRIRKKIDALESEIISYLDMLPTAPPATRERLFQRIETQTAQKETAETELARAELSARTQLKEEDVIKWIKNFCVGDLLDPEFQQRLFDTFINAIFLFEDKIVIYYNVKNGKQVSFFEMVSDLNDPDDDPDPNEPLLPLPSGNPSGSDLLPSTPLKNRTDLIFCGCALWEYRFVRFIARVFHIFCYLSKSEYRQNIKAAQCCFGRL